MEDREISSRNKWLNESDFIRQRSDRRINNLWRLMERKSVFIDRSLSRHHEQTVLSFHWASRFPISINYSVVLLWTSGLRTIIIANRPSHEHRCQVVWSRSSPFHIIPWFIFYSKVFSSFNSCVQIADDIYFHRLSDLTTQWLAEKHFPLRLFAASVAVQRP